MILELLQILREMLDSNSTASKMKKAESTKHIISRYYPADVAYEAELCAFALKLLEHYGGGRIMEIKESDMTVEKKPINSRHAISVRFIEIDAIFDKQKIDFV